MPVKQGRTIDLVAMVATSTWGVRLTQVLDLSIAGATTVTNEAVLGQADEEASVHAAGQSFSFGTIYDGTETDTLREHSGDNSDVDPYVAVIEPRADLRSFEIAQASVLGLAQSAPAADAITDTLTMPQSDRAYFGTGGGVCNSVRPENRGAHKGHTTTDARDYGNLPCGGFDHDRSGHHVQVRLKHP